MSTPTEPLEQWSKRVFNSTHRLRVASLLSEATEVVDHEWLVSRGIKRTAAHNELAFHVELGTLQRLEESNRVYYQRRPSAYWPWIAELTALVRQGTPAS